MNELDKLAKVAGLQERAVDRVQAQHGAVTAEQDHLAARQRGAQIGKELHAQAIVQVQIKQHEHIAIALR